MKLRQLRKEAGLTQVLFSQKINQPQSQISNWEGGYVIPSPINIRRMNTIFQDQLSRLGMEELNKFDFGAEENSLL